MKWIALLLFGAGWAGGCAEAQGLTLSPVMLSAPAEGGATSLTVSSDLDEPKLVQVRVFDWTQEDGGEQMLPARNVRFGPEIFEIAPGKSQTVRFSLPHTDGEGAWRVVVDELPSSTAPGKPAETQLSLRLRYVLSMFAGEAGVPEDLKARAVAGGLELHNAGQGWLKIHGLAVTREDGRAEPAGPGLVYLLPGARTVLEAAIDEADALNFSVGSQVYSARLRHGE